MASFTAVLSQPPALPCPSSFASPAAHLFLLKKQAGLQAPSFPGQPSPQPPSCLKKELGMGDTRDYFPKPVSPAPDKRGWSGLPGC